MILLILLAIGLPVLIGWALYGFVTFVDLLLFTVAAWLVIVVAAVGSLFLTPIFGFAVIIGTVVITVKKYSKR